MMDATLALGVGVAAGTALGAATSYVLSRRSRRPAVEDEARRGELLRRESVVEREQARLAEAAKALEAAQGDAVEDGKRARDRLAEAAGFSPEAARARALEDLDKDLLAERSRRVAAAVIATRAEAEAKARAIVCTALQRVAASHASERTVTSVALPDDSFKGRVIGREGRNVQAFERLTGCDVLVDDTPGVVTISGFDPVRREIARRALVTLIADGRIQPARIEEVVEATKRSLEEDLLETGKKALLECDVGEAHPRVIALLGRLQYRTSYGQNVLRHSVEVAHLCGAMAGEMGLDPRIARRAGLLHDLGKAVDHEVEGSHATIGGEILKRSGETPLLVNAVASHHEDVPQESAYAVLAQAADAISAARPGARVDSADRYVRRLKDLEAVAASFAGVTEVFAIQAGREVRVLVDGSKVSDAAAPLLAREIARAVEAELAYPGEIRVTVLRNTSAVAYAR